MFQIWFLIYWLGGVGDSALNFGPQGPGNQKIQYSNNYFIKNQLFQRFF